MSLRSDADKIMKESLQAVLPDRAVRRALKDYQAGDGRTVLIAAEGCREHPGRELYRYCDYEVRTCKR